MSEESNDREYGVVCGARFDVWLSEPLLGASSAASLRCFACQVAKLALSQCDAPNKQVIHALEACEKWSTASDFKLRIASEAEAVERIAQTADADPDRWICARAYYSASACFYEDALEGAAHALYEARWACDEKSDEDFRAEIEPLLSLLE